MQGIRVGMSQRVTPDPKMIGGREGEACGGDVAPAREVGPTPTSWQLTMLPDGGRRIW